MKDLHYSMNAVRDWNMKWNNVQCLPRTATVNDVLPNSPHNRQDQYHHQLGHLAQTPYTPIHHIHSHVAFIIEL